LKLSLTLWVSEDVTCQLMSVQQGIPELTPLNKKYF